MRRRYGGKRSIRRRGRGRKRRSKHLLSAVDHSSKCFKFSKAIAKGISKKRYDTCTTVVTDHISSVGGPSSPPDVSSLSMTPFHTVFGLSGDTQAFTAFACMNGKGGTDQVFNRHANMYTQYRIKCIRFEFVPTTAVVGRETNLPSAFGDWGITADAVASRMDLNQEVGATMWMLKWPNKSGTFQDFGQNFNNPSVNYVPNAAALQDPSVIKIPITEKLTFNWKPKILGYRASSWRPLTSAGALTNAQATFYPVAKKYPWTNIIDNFDHPSVAGIDQNVGMVPTGGSTGVAGPYNTTGLRQPMSFPLLSIYNSSSNQFVNASSDYIPSGRWFMHTVFEFKTKRDMNANQIAANITEAIPNQITSFAPSVPTINF